jgi:hypothetical protein
MTLTGMSYPVKYMMFRNADFAVRSRATLRERALSRSDQRNIIFAILAILDPVFPSLLFWSK